MQINQNFDAINQAVDAESQKQFNINKVARSKYIFFSTAFVFLIIGGVLLVALLILAIYKLFFYEPIPKKVEVPFVVEKQVPVNIDKETLQSILSNLPINDLNITPNDSQSSFTSITEGNPLEEKTRSELLIKEQTWTQDISNTTLKQENNQVVKGEYIQTSFTIFHHAQAANGEVVTTGKTYSPENIKVPINQFCYLQSPDDQIVGGKSIANYGEFGFELTASDAYEKQLANKYCLFDKN